MGNKIADFLAKTGTKELADNFEILIKDLRNIYKDKMWVNTQDNIREIRFKGIYYFSNFYDKNNKVPWFYQFNEER